MYQSKKSIQKKSLPALKKDFLIYIQDHTKIFCSSLGRWVFLSKQPQAILKRKDAKYRLECFFAGIDILKHSKTITKWNKKEEKGYAIQGLSQDRKRVTIHLREEKDAKKDRKLFLISTFYK